MPVQRIIPGVPLDLHEISRTYTFRGGDRIRLDNVKELVVTSHSHRLKTVDREGNVKLHIIPMTFLHVEIVANEDWDY